MTDPAVDAIIAARVAEQAAAEAEQAAFRRRNVRLMAERAKWPAGALEACERLEDAYPGWTLWWARANTVKGFERPEGFIAVWRGRPLTGLQVLAPDPAGVELLIAAQDERIEAERDLRARQDAWMWSRPRRPR